MQKEQTQGQDFKLQLNKRENNASGRKKCPSPSNFTTFDKDTRNTSSGNGHNLSILATNQLVTESRGLKHVNSYYNSSRKNKDQVANMGGNCSSRPKLMVGICANKNKNDVLENCVELTTPKQLHFTQQLDPTVDMYEGSPLVLKVCIKGSKLFSLIQLWVGLFNSFFASS